MRCCDCKYFHDGLMYNRCDLAEMEYFVELKDCTLVNDNMTINFSERAEDEL